MSNVYELKFVGWLQSKLFIFPKLVCQNQNSRKLSEPYYEKFPIIS